MSRRLALLSEQLASAREEATAVGDEWWDEHTRISSRPSLHVVADDVPEPVVVPAPVVVPVPGRHADRRRLAWADVVPDTLRGQVGLGPGPIAVVAVLVAVGLAFTCWQVVRDDPDDPVPVAAAAGQSDLVPVAVPTAADPPAPSAAATGGAATGTVTVDVAGRVRRPGIVVLPTGARVVDALDEAGGARPAVDLTSLNLARVLVDGEQLLVGVPGAAGVSVPPSTAGSATTTPAALVDLNTADLVQLDELPEVGPVTAAAIIAWRDEHGAFTAVTELLEVDGIGDATLAKLTPLVTV